MLFLVENLFSYLRGWDYIYMNKFFLVGEVLEDSQSLTSSYGDSTSMRMDGRDLLI